MSLDGGDPLRKFDITNYNKYPLFLPRRKQKISHPFLSRARREPKIGQTTESLDIFQAVFPASTTAYRGGRVPLGFFVLLAIMSTARSLVHLLAPDGGAASIAGINLAVAGGSNIVAIFSQWGASQLLLAFVQWLVIWR